MKIYKFRLKFQWIFLRVQLTKLQHYKGRRQALFGTNDGQVYWPIYVSRGIDVLISFKYWTIPLQWRYNEYDGVSNH